MQPSDNATQPLAEETDIYDVVIVGSGPAGLAVAARLREDTPAAIFTDEEHRRFQWLRKHGKHVSVKQVKTKKEVLRKGSCGSINSGSPSFGMRMVVVDASADRWLGRWNRLFSAYNITHLRSPLLWHVDPKDRDSLLARAHEQGTPDDLFDIGACVGKEISKHLKKKRSARRGGLQDSQPNIDINERDRNDYFTPSRKLFCDHCDSVRDRYELVGGILKHETLCDLDYGVVFGVSIGDEQLFTVTTDKARRYARIVILAVGPANTPRMPEIPGLTRSTNSNDEGVAGMEEELLHSDTVKGELGEPLYPLVCHTFHLRHVPDPVVAARIRARQPTNVLVVGGGLTSAQIADLALRRGVTRVWHLMRGGVVVKYFDVDLSWMGKYRNREQARFWSADTDAERLAIVREARGGGSITPHFHKILKKHVVTGRVMLHTQTMVTGLEFVEQPDVSSSAPRGGRWKVTTEPPIPDMPPVDYIYFATGIETDVERLPYLQTLLSRFPIDTVGGFPCLTEDLMWADGVPLFCIGKLATLRIGPAAPNIGGAKLAAERIGLAVEDILRRSSSNTDADDGDEVGGKFTTDYVSGMDSKYKCLEHLGL